MLIFLPNLGMGASSADAPAPAPSAQRGVGRTRGRRRELPTLLRFIVELGSEKHYFRTESEARSFLEKRARVLYKRALVVSRSKVELPEKAKRIPLRQESPIPRFVSSGNAAVALLTQQINARIDAILSNPERDADEDDEDLMRILQ